MAQFEEQISKRIREFDPLSLILLLEHHGYSRELVRFRSHPSYCSQTTLFEAIEFHQEPAPHVVISVNMGLLSAQTCIPSFVLNMLEQAPISAIRFLQFFDHPLLNNFFRSIYPEIDTRIFADFAGERRNQLLSLGLRSPCTLHWALALVFPELEVRVEKAVLPRTLGTRPFVLGTSGLGSSQVLGCTFTSAVYGLRVQLFSEEESAADGTPWVKVIERRLDALLFPVLSEVGVELEIFLVLRGQQSWARLSSTSFLGYDTLKGGRKQSRRLLIFSGTVLK